MVEVGSISGCAAVGLSMVNRCSSSREDVVVFGEIILRIASLKQVHFDIGLPAKRNILRTITVIKAKIGISSSILIGSSMCAPDMKL